MTDDEILFALRPLLDRFLLSVSHSVDNLNLDGVPYLAYVKACIVLLQCAYDIAPSGFPVHVLDEALSYLNKLTD